MEKQEFFLLIPAIIYGVAIVDLLKIFRHKKTYWEVLIWGLLLMIIIINTWTELYQKLEHIVDNTFHFFIVIAQAILYAQAANIITPEEKHVDTRDYFFSIKKSFFLTLGSTTLMNLLVNYFVLADDREIWIRPTAFALVLVCAFVDKVWVRTTIWAFFSVLSVFLVFLA
jgi:hypothetical protein